MAIVNDAVSMSAEGRPYTVSTFHHKVRQFEKMLATLTLRGLEASPDERRQLISDDTAAFGRFCEDVRQLFGSHIRDEDLKQLHRKVQANPDCKVDWSEVFGYFNVAREEEPVDDTSEVSVFATPLRRCIGDAAGGKKRRDVARSIHYVKALDSYVVAAQRGIVTFWSRKLEITSCLSVEDNLWIVDCDFLPNTKKMVCCSEKNLVIWDPRTKANSSRMFSLKPSSNVLHCMCVLPHRKLNEDVVLVGDDTGNIIAVTISAQDLASKNTKTAQAVDIEDVVPIDPADLLTPIVTKAVHPEAVSKIKFFPELNCFGSSSTSAATSFVLEEVHRLQSTEELRGFSIPKGLTCFDYSVSTNLIAAGGADKIIRLFIPHIDKPTGKLKGHLFTITDLCINDIDKHVISISSARVIRVWDILTMTNLQVFSDKEDRLGEKRIYCIMFDPNLEVLITCSSVIDCWPLTRNTQGSVQVPATHEKPIAHMLHNELLEQLVTICTEPIIKVWDIKSGTSLYKILEPHGRNVEITSAAIDVGGYKLATGAADGTLKTWDFGSGRQLKTLPDDLLSSISKKGKSASVQALCIHKVEKHRILAAYSGSGKFVLYTDVEKIQFLQYFSLMDDETPKGRVLQNERVTCSCLLLPESVITGMTDGSIVIWNMKKRKADQVFPISNVEKRATQPTEYGDDAEQTDQVNTLKLLRVPRKLSSRPVRPDVSARKLASDDPTIAAINGNNEERGLSTEVDVGGPEVLVATVHQDATLRFWDLSGRVLLQTVPEMRHANPGLTALAFNKSGSSLVVGDSSGFLTLFRITDFLAKVMGDINTISATDITQVVTWRGHPSRVVNVSIVDAEGVDIIYTASIDGSVRVWKGTRGNYLGYLGQATPLEVHAAEDLESPAVKPSDISESPIEYEEIAKREARPKNPPKLEVPLVQTKERPNPRRADVDGGFEEENAYFKSLAKPKAYRDHLPVIEEPKHSNKDGFVFRSLPVYQIITPERIKTPVLEKGLRSQQAEQTGKQKKK